jgi:hypothetical protein
MSKRESIRLPRSVRPIFPDRCVFCGVSAPKQQLSLAANSTENHSYSRFIYSAPVCPPCEKKFVSKEPGFLSRFSYPLLLGVLIILVLLVDRLKIRGDQLIKVVIGFVAIMLIFLAVTIIQLLWLMLSPRQPFGARIAGDEIEYLFADSGLAQEFRTLNEGNPADPVLTETARSQKSANGILTGALALAWILGSFVFPEHAESITLVAVIGAMIIVKAVFTDANRGRSNTVAAAPPRECGQCGITLKPRASKCHFCGWEAPPS